MLLTERNANYLPLGFLSHSSEYYIKVPNGRISVINALPSSSSKEIVKLVNEVLALAPADLAIVDESSNIV